MKKYLINQILKLKIVKKTQDYLKTRARVQNEILKGLIFNNTICDSEWLKYKSFSPGLWAADYGLLYTLYRVLNGIKPNNVLEFGLGQSSKMLHQYGNFFHANVVTCEHDESWIRFFNEGRDGKYDVNIKKLELESIIYNGFETLSYKDIIKEIGNIKYDLIIVDGPFGSKHFSRPQIIELSQKCLADSFCIIMDDTHREGEMETAIEVQRVLKDLGVNYCSTTYSSSKKHTLICSPDLNFLTSL
jgi:hypothetical protein